MTDKQFSAPALWLLLAALLAGSTTTVRAAAPVYDVEIVIFRHKPVTDAGERWNRPVQDELRAGGVFPQGEFSELDRSLHRLEGVRGGLRNSRNYEVLAHRAWRQVGYDTAHAVPYPVQAYTGNGDYRVEGSVKLVRERYLHLDVDLLLLTAGGAPGQYTEAPGSRPAFELREKRRMRSRELHYFDHPRFGVIALVTPHDAPDDEPEADEAEAADAPGEPEAADEPETAPADDQLTR